jgi:hypothetical protein
MKKKLNYRTSNSVNLPNINKTQIILDEKIIRPIWTSTPSTAIVVASNISPRSYFRSSARALETGCSFVKQVTTHI